MFTFDHFTTINLSKDEYAKATLPKEWAVFTTVDAKGDATIKVPTKITVPLTLDELVAAADKTETEVTFGTGKTAVTHKVPQVVADFIVGYKLRINQNVQKQRKGDSGKMSQRALTAAWYSQQGTEKATDLFQRMLANNSPAKLKEHNAWLDKLYSDNQAAVDAYVPPTGS